MHSALRLKSWLLVEKPEKPILKNYLWVLRKLWSKGIYYRIYISYWIEFLMQFIRLFLSILFGLQRFDATKLGLHDVAEILMKGESMTLCQNQILWRVFCNASCISESPLKISSGLCLRNHPQRTYYVNIEISISYPNTKKDFLWEFSSILNNSISKALQSRRAQNLFSELYKLKTALKFFCFSTNSFPF
jgi:hypothetical protein